MLELKMTGSQFGDAGNTLSIAQLAVVVQLASCGSFREAANTAGVSQPAFSRLIKQIETRLGVRLFDRDTHRTALTPAGEKLLPLAQDLLARYHQCFNQFEEYKRGGKGAIRIAVLPSFAATLLPDLLHSFSQSHPQIRFELWEEVGAPIHRAVREGQVDFGIAPPPRDDELSYKHLLDDELMLIAPAGHPSLSSDHQGWDIFAEEPYIALSGETGLRLLVDQALTNAGVAANPMFVCKHPTSLAAFVAAGFGVAALSRLTLAQLGNERIGGMRLQPVVSRPIGIVTHVRRTQPAFVHQFLRELIYASRRPSLGEQSV